MLADRMVGLRDLLGHSAGIFLRLAGLAGDLAIERQAFLRFFRNPLKGDRQRLVHFAGAAVERDQQFFDPLDHAIGGAIAIFERLAQGGAILFHRRHRKGQFCGFLAAFIVQILHIFGDVVDILVERDRQRLQPLLFCIGNLAEARQCGFQRIQVRPYRQRRFRRFGGQLCPAFVNGRDGFRRRCPQEAGQFAGGAFCCLKLFREAGPDLLGFGGEMIDGPGGFVGQVRQALLGSGAHVADLAERRHHSGHFRLGGAASIADLVGHILGGADHHRQMFAQLFEIAKGGAPDIIQFLHLAETVVERFADQAGGGRQLAGRLAAQRFQFPALLAEKFAGHAEFVIDRLQPGFEQFGLAAQGMGNVGKAMGFAGAVAHVEQIKNAQRGDRQTPLRQQLDPGPGGWHSGKNVAVGPKEKSGPASSRYGQQQRRPEAKAGRGRQSLVRIVAPVVIRRFGAIFLIFIGKILLLGSF